MMRMTKRKKEDVNKNALAIFIKNPILGKAKTRIAKDSSDEIALDIYNNLLGITREIAKNLDCNKYVFYDKFIDENDAWDNGTFNKKVQGGNDLGERMFNAFTILKNEHNEKAVLIGSDCPYLSSSIIDSAFKSLDESDYVLGPTFDGGYYLIGMKNPNNLIFSDIEWSKETVFEKTLERIFAVGGKYHLLEKLKDVDHLADWEEYSGRLN